MRISDWSSDVCSSDLCAAVSRAAVETNAETGRTAIREQATVVRREAVFRLFGGDAALQRVTIEAHLILRRQRGGGAISGVADAPAFGDAGLGLDDVDAGDLFGNRVFDPDARIDLADVERAGVARQSTRLHS